MSVDPQPDMLREISYEQQVDNLKTRIGGEDDATDSGPARDGGAAHGRDDRRRGGGRDR